ncbi:MAG TPA: CARDB domain-containing protein, partial [Thermoanaerobaculia bacterium]
MDTALAALALAGKPDAPAAALAAASRFLIANQVPGAGWGNVLGGASRTGATALALEALRSLNAAAANPAPVATALAWLAGKQNADGGFGDSPSTAHDTAAALLAAVDLGQGGAVRAGDATTYLVTHQSTEGSWEGSTFTTASVVAALDRSTLPNWAFSGPLAATPAQPADGDRVAIAMTVLSNGDVGAPAGVVRVYDGDPAAGGTAIGADLAIPPLGAGQTASLTATWDTLGKAGSHTLFAVIDPDGRVAELSKTDNQATLAVTVAAAPAGVDLEVRGADVTVSPPHPATLPVQLAISAVVRNNGQTGAPAVDVRLYLGTPPAATVLGDVTVSVPGRSSAAANFVYTLTTPGTTVLTVVADPDNLIPETDKTNNAASVTVTTAASSDLGLSSSDIQLAGSAYLGNDATFHVTLHNFGTVDSQSAQVQYTVTDGTTTRNLPQSTVAIAAGGTAQETVVWRVDLTGSLTFTVDITTVDSNPANNQASLAFTASAVSVPNLVIGRGDLTLAPTPGLQGQPLTATAVVHNTGGQDVANVQVGLYDGDPAQGGALIGGALQVVPSLPAGGSATVAATLASIPDANDHLIYAVADPNNQVSELTKDDNSTFIVLPVLSLPDAAITQGSLVLQPAFPAPGQAVTLTVAVANLGQQLIPALLVRAYDGDPAQGGVAVGDQTIALPGSGGAQAVIGWTLGGASGPRTLFVVLDPNDAVVEASKANNSASLAIVVQQGDFTVSNRYFSPNGDGVQDTTELDFRLSGPMTVSIQAVDVRGNVVRTAAGAGYANVAGGSFVWDGKDDAGRVVADGDYVLRVVAADGTAQGQAVTTVDTDRLPLFAALGTPFANFVNLTCQIPFVAGPFFYSDDEQAIYFLENNAPPDPVFGTGVYQMAPAGGSAQQLVPTFWFGGSRPSQLVASADGSRLAFDAYPPGVPASCPPSAANPQPTVPTLWTVPSDGSTLPVALGCGYATLVGFDASGQNVTVDDGQSILSLPVAGGAPRTVFTPPGGLLYSSLSPDRLLLAVTGTTIVDLASGVATPIAVTGTATSLSWSPDSQHLALAVDTSVVVVGRDGTVQQTFAMPADVSDLPPGFFPNPLPGGSGPAPGLGVPEWSSDSSELGVLLDYDGCHGFVGGIFGYFWSRVVTADLATGTVQTVALGQPEPSGCDSFHVSTWDGKSWAERGVLHYDARRRERSLDLDRFLPDARGEYRVRIRQTGYGEAHVDSVALFSGANRQLPTAAVRLSDGKDVRAEVAAHDHRGIELHDAEMELVWKDVLHGRVRLALAATEGRPEDFAVPGVASPGRRGASAAGQPGSRLADRSASGQAPAPALLPSIFFGHLFWAPNQRQLAVSDLSTHTIDLDAGNLVATIQAFGQDIFIDGFSPVGRYMELGFFGPDPSTVCYQAYGHTWAMRSLMNLTADLQVRQTPGVSGYLLEGTAADLHFARYQLDYASAANPGIWTPIAPPSTTPVLDSQFTNWVPPGPGSYLVRLTVQDLAGNSRTAVRRVSSSDSPSITDLSITPRYFSPNGDGVLDTATIHYRVLQPVHLDFRFFDGTGNLVRTISQDHSEIGSSFDVVWDGRGDDGQVVPDGEYTVKVLSYELFVTVDTTPPTVDLELLPARECDLTQGVIYAPSLSVKFDDANGIATSSVETGVGAAPVTWLPSGTGPPGEALFDNHSFRATATDVAGNTTVRQVPPIPEQLFLTGIDTKTIDPKTGQLKPLPPLDCALNPQLKLPEAVTRVQIGESITAPISQLFVETQAAPLLPNGNPDLDPTHLQGNQWRAEAITAFYLLGSNATQTTIPETQFEIDWDLANVVPGTETAARLHAIDETGADHYSDPFYVLAAGVFLIGFLGSGSPGDVGNAVANLLQQQGLAPPQDAVLLGLSFSSQALANVTLVMSSDEDPNFQAPRFYTPVASDGTNYLFSSPDWRPCIKYRAYLVAQTAPQIDPATGEALTVTFVTDEEVIQRPCLMLSVTVEPQPPENPACDTNLGTQRTLVMTPVSLDGTPLQLLSVTGPGGVLFSVSNPASGTQYRYSFDLAGQPAGTLPLVAHITSTAGKEQVAIANVVVETAPPVAAITSPSPGQTFCKQVDVEGTVDDQAGFMLHLDSVDAPAKGGRLHFQGTVATLRGDGSFTTRLVATNQGGFTACSAPLTVNVVSQVRGPAISALPWIVSPNGDGIADTTTLTLGAAEPTQVGLVVQPAVREVLFGVINICAVYGVPARTLATGMPLAASTNAGTVTWDGKGDDGSVVPDGDYAAVATFQDSCGNQAAINTCLEVDTTPPQLAIDYPQAGDPLALVVEVRGLVTDALSGVQGWSLEYGVGSDPPTWAGIAGGYNEVRHDFLGAWNTFGLSGAYTLRLRAVDVVGNASEVRVPLTLAQRVQLITSLAAQPRLFSPNGDGRLDTTSVLFGLGAAASGNLQVQDAGGAVVRNLLVNAPLPQGASSAAWDGTTDAGQPAPDGDYTVVLAVQAAANSSFTDQQSITVTLDRTPPTVTITRPLPGGYVAPIGGVTGTITDAHLASWSVSLTSTPQAPVWTQIASGTSNVTAATLASLTGLAEGTYALKVDAADAGQIQVEQIIPFTVDATPPKVTLTSPAAGAILGSVGGLVTVAGSVVEDHLQDWRVELGSGPAPASWTALATGTSLPVPSPALAWNVGGVADGDYTLRLIADELTGQTGEARVAVTIDNTAPVVAILSPADGGTVTGPVDIVGTATDAHLVEYRLAVAPGPKATAAQFSNLGAGSSSVQSGRLLSWTALPPDGVVTLRLTAVDRAGNQSAAYAQLTVHTRAPAAPQGLTAQVDHRDVHLAWLPNTETGLAGYRVWRNGAVVTSQPVTGTSYVDAGLAAGTYTYTLTAVDQYALESVPSAAATATIDLTAPTALISRPRNGSRTGGVVDVIGSAYKQNDFKEYRVYATPADGSAPPQLLRRSPVPIQAALLVQWSTLSLTDGSSFVLRLEAEDLAGNVAAAEVTVTVDNTPPAAPTGLTATPDGTTIHLAWNANSESDLAGYLLYRNGKVANAAGPVVGDLTPYLLTSPAYDDLALPDGTFVYVVYAVDQAGNQSPPSAPAQASLDNHPPHVVITQPAAGALFQDSLDIVGTTPDLDVVNVQFQWQPAGAAGWNDLGAALTAPPWEVIWSTTAIAYGDYMIRAVATDAGGRTDPAPAAVPVTRKNLAKPPAPTGLAAAVNGGNVTLTWTAGTPPAPDLAGYLVSRTAADGTVTQLTASPIAATTYVDAGLADGTYSYAVTAMNQAGNSSAPAGPQSAVVYSLALTQPYTPTSATATDLAGAGAAAGAQVAGTTTGPAGSTPIGAVAADGGGNFTFTALPLARGDNQLAVSASDAAGNTSKTASVPVLTADPPAQPTGVTAAAGSDNVVQLGWNANPAADNVRGYRLTRDGGPQPAPALVDGPVTASSSGATPNGPANAVDGDPATYWSPVAGSDPDLRNQWLELDWPNAEQVARFEIDWGGEPQSDGSMLVHNAGDYLLEGWDGRVWVPLARQSGDAAAATRIVPALPYLTNRVRLQLLPSSALPWVAEMRVYQYPLTTATTASDTPGGGAHSYQVIAVGPLGIESQPSAPAMATVGTPPAALTLSGTANGSEVDLSWTASTSPNIAYYLVFREGAQIAQVTNPATLVYADAGRPDGTWHYTVEAVDQLGNVSAPSNVVAVTVTVAPPPAPSGLTVTVVPAGGALDLSWTVAAGTPARTVFEVERGTVSGGPYQVVAKVPAAPYRDSGLTNGQTYYYVAVAVDGLGNASAASNEASGTPADTTPPPQPVLHFPAISTLQFQTSDDTADLAGSAEPGATVSVTPAGAGGSRSTQALPAAAVEQAVGAAFRLLPPSPDGRYLLQNLDGGGAVTLVDFDAAGGPATVTLPPLNPAPFGVSWMADGRGLLLITGGEIDSYRFAGNLRAPLTTLDIVYAVTAAPDGVRLAILGSLSGQAGLWVFDPSAGSLGLLAAFDPTAAAPSSLVWSPEGSYVAYVGPQPASSSGGAGVVVVQVAAPSAATLVEANPGSGRPSFTPDGSAVAYTEVVAAGGEKVRFTTLADGTAVDLTGVQPGPLLPQLSPDGSMLAYATAAGVVAGSVAPFGPSSPAPPLLSNLAGDTAQDLAWVPGGYLLVAAGDEFRIAPAGRFALAGVALAVGENSFTATARDAAGNVSAVSAPRVIHRAAANLPDFAIAPADLALLPAAPLAGQAVRVSATVHNLGPADAPATTLALTAYGPGATQVPLATALAVPAIAAGGMATVTQDGAIPGPAGAWTLVAQVDPQGLVQQVSTANDRAQISFQVVSQGPPAVTVTTDAASYQPNATLTAAVTVFNGSTTFSGQALVTIEDTQGFAVTTLPAIPVDQLGYAQQLTQQATWNVGSTFAGNYLVDVKLQDGQGNTVA